MATNAYTDTTARPTVGTQVFGNSFIANFRAAMQRRAEQARIRAELGTMTPRELADLGLHPSDIDDVARGNYRRG